MLASLPRGWLVFVLGACLARTLSCSAVQHEQQGQCSWNPFEESYHTQWQHRGDACRGIEGEGVCELPDAERPRAGEETRVEGGKQDAQQQQLHSEEVAGQYIVRFRAYRMADEHLSALASALSEQGAAEADWEWVPRRNAAAAFPTDFGLLQLSSHVQNLLALLAKLPFVKDVHQERRLTRGLAWAGEHEGGLGVERGHKRGQAEGADGGEMSAREHARVEKRPGRLSTRFSEGVNDAPADDDSAAADDGLARLRAGLGEDAVKRQLLSSGRRTVPALLHADELWAAGYRGALVRMGVFDTGIRSDHPHVKNIRERTNWTHEPTLEDGLGHGTFVAGVVAGGDSACPGFAPEVELYTFRVFTNDQVSYTSWFLDAFNYAIATKMNVVNLSIGGPDYLDQPFVEKVWEITSNGILMISAIGNDGPLYGTLNNPADQSDVIGVGGIDYQDAMAAFSSRGMSTWELPRGYGRAKPDVVAYGRDVMGSRIQGGCRSLSGTSVASPVVAGAVCLLASVVPEQGRWNVLNPASMKQALVEGATRIPGINMYEQGQGKLNLLNSRDILLSYKPRASVVPPALDFTDCPYMWPFCRQPLYAHAMPLIFNATVLNGMGLTGKFEGPPTFAAANAGGKLLDVRFTYSDVIWPWSGFLGVYIRVTPEGEAFEGIAQGNITFTIVSPPARGEAGPRRSTVVLPVTAQIIPTPPRQRRLLWDQFHSLRYPPAYLPRDALEVRTDILDWHGDHPHTNYHDLYNVLRDAGYYLEVLGAPLTCFDASQYGALLLVDLEEEYYPGEAAKLAADVAERGLGLVAVGEWYNTDTMVAMKFFDDNTRSWWTPVTGGANIPAFNELLAPLGIAFGDAILEGAFQLGGEAIHYASGANIVRFPKGGFIHGAALQDKATTGTARTSGRFGGTATGVHAVLGVAAVGKGRVAAYGDSNCLDSSHQRSSCYQLLKKLLEYLTEGIEDPKLFAPDTQLAEELGTPDMPLPTRRSDVNMTQYSTVLSEPLSCRPLDPLPGAIAGNESAGQAGASQRGGARRHAKNGAAAQKNVSLAASEAGREAGVAEKPGGSGGGDGEEKMKIPDEKLEPGTGDGRIEAGNVAAIAAAAVTSVAANQAGGAGDAAAGSSGGGAGDGSATAQKGKLDPNADVNPDLLLVSNFLPQQATGNASEIGKESLAVGHSFVDAGSGNGEEVMGAESDGPGGLEKAAGDGERGTGERTRWPFLGAEHMSQVFGVAGVLGVIGLYVIGRKLTLARRRKSQSDAEESSRHDDKESPNSRLGRSQVGQVVGRRAGPSIV